MRFPLSNEIGMGIHGEPGMKREKLQTADQIAERMLGAIVADMPLARGDRVAVMVHGLGATPPEELYVLYRKVHELLTGAGVGIHRGVRRRVCHEHGDGGRLADAVQARRRAGIPARCACRDAVFRADFGAQMTMAERSDGTAVVAAIERVAARLIALRDRLNQLDAAVGDGDLGITAAKGASALREYVSVNPSEDDLGTFFFGLGRALNNKALSTMGRTAAERHTQHQS